jgi:DNA-binding response OmpR family regulator
MRERSILLVEDEKDIRDTVAFHLARHGFRVKEAESGTEALAELERSLPDLVILDWMLPEMDGLEVCRRLRQREEAAFVSVMMLTARNGAEDTIAALEAGADDYVTKPFHLRVLTARIGALLRKSAIRRRVALVCCYCRNIRDDNGSWRTMEDHMTQRFEWVFSHGVCEVCRAKGCTR